MVTEAEVPAPFSVAFVERRKRWCFLDLRRRVGLRVKWGLGEGAGRWVGMGGENKARDIVGELDGGEEKVQKDMAEFDL